MRDRRNFLAAAGSVGVVITALGWTRPAWAPLCPSCKTTSLVFPLAGLIFFRPNPCVAAGEYVTLAGGIHVVAVVGPNFVADIYLNTAGLQGTGQTSGGLYIGTGAQEFTDVQYPQGGGGGAGRVLPAAFTIKRTFGGIAPGVDKMRCPSMPFFVAFTAAFSSDGTLLAESTVTVCDGDCGGT